MDLRTLLIGASGQVGRALAAAFADTGLIAASNSHAQPGEARIDLGDPASIAIGLAAARPDIVLVAGAMCNVDGCELDPEPCERINVEGPAAVAEYAAAHGARVVFFSSDHVFDGAKDRYVEDDAVRPLNHYARSKADAEARIRAILPDRHLILRTGWVYGPDTLRRNFALRLVDRLTAGEQVVVPSDQWGCPTYTEDLARAARTLVDLGESGTFHVTGTEFIARAELSLRICAAFGVAPRNIVAKPSSELNQAARRSLRVRLDCGKAYRAGVPAFRGIDDGLRALAAATASMTATR